MNIILTGATGMVGEGVLLECLENPAVTSVLSVSRKPYGLQHPKLKELVVPDFLKINNYSDKLSGYDGCFFCSPAVYQPVGQRITDLNRAAISCCYFFVLTLY